MQNSSESHGFLINSFVQVCFFRPSSKNRSLEDNISLKCERLAQLKCSSFIFLFTTASNDTHSHSSRLFLKLYLAVVRRLKPLNKLHRAASMKKQQLQAASGLLQFNRAFVRVELHEASFVGKMFLPYTCSIAHFLTSFTENEWEQEIG